MNWRDLRLRVRALVAPRKVERELDEELAFHVEMETRKQVAAGVSPGEARARARKRFGPASIADDCRDARGIAFVDTCVRDILYAIRSFRRTPTVAATVIGTIALGLGVNAALFTLFNALLFRPEAVRDPDSLFSYSWSTPGRSAHQFTLREYEEFRRGNEVFSDVAARRVDVLGRIDGRGVKGHLVTGNFFQVLGVNAALGRMLTPADAPALGREPVVVLSHGAWQRLFAGDPGIVGRSILINGLRCEVIGVTAEGFHGLDTLTLDFWAPLTLAAQIDQRSALPPNAGGFVPANPNRLEIIGRLRPDMPETTARAALGVWVSRMATGRAADGRPPTLVFNSKGTSAAFDLQSMLVLSPLFAAFGLVLLIACANVANLMLARAVARQREIGIRLSLGASRGRIIRQLLTESLLLALAAAACALFISKAVVDTAWYFLYSTMPAELAELISLPPLSTDYRIAGFLVFTAVVSAALFGLVPALQATRPNLLRIARGDFGNEVRPGRARSVLIVVQVTASALLLICAALALRVAARVAAVDPGVRMSDTIIIDKPGDPSRAAVVAALASESIVASFTHVWPSAPLMGRPREASASPDSAEATADRPAGPARNVGASPASYTLVSSEYFDVLDIDILSGRPFTKEEATARAAVAVVSEAVARQFWPGANAVGQLLRVDDDDNRVPRSNEPALRSPVVVVVLGVVRNVSSFSAESAHGGLIYLPITATEAGATIIARVHGDPEVARRRLTDRLTAIDPSIQLILTMRTVGAMFTYPLRLVFWVTMVLGALALALTLSGIYGVLSYLVVQRTKEIGVRMALGATAGTVTRLVLWQSLRLIAVGLAVGAGLALAVSTVLRSIPVPGPFVGTVNLFDGIAYGGSLLSILAACILAASVPALRAARIDPIATLRHD